LGNAKADAALSAAGMAQELMARMQPIMQAFQPQMAAGGTVDWDKVCVQYDALIKQAQ
jgi:hypothetical protein